MSSRKIFFFLFIFALVLRNAAAETAAPQPTPPSPQESVTIDFDNVDIRLVIKYLSEITQTNYVVDKEVAGKVTVMSPAKMSLEEAQKVLETLLAVNGYAIVETGGVKRVVPSGVAMQSQMQTLVGKEPAGENSEARMVTQIVPLDFADAEKVKNVIAPYVTKSGHVASYRPTNTLIITESTANLTKLLSIVRSLDSQMPGGRDNMHVIALKNASAKEVASLLTTLFQEQKRSQSARGEGSDTGGELSPSIVAHEATNSLVVEASPQDYAVVEKTIRQMDVVKDQVYVEVLIVEMSLEKAAEYGLELANFGGIAYGNEKGFAGISGTEGPFKGILTGGKLRGKVVGVSEGENTKGDFKVPDVGLLVKAFDDDKDVNILSTPQIIATDNEQARILVGSRLAFIKNSQVTAEGGTVATFEFREIGLELVITPHIGQNDFVRLEVEQRTEDVVGQSFEGAPETAKRETKTTVLVRDNGTIVLGGLIRDEKVKKVRKVPVLGDIPILKLAFRSEDTQVKKMNLLVFLTPHILRTSEMAQALSGSKREQMEKNYGAAKKDMKQVEKEKLPVSAFSIER